MDVGLRAMMVEEMVSRVAHRRVQTGCWQRTWDRQLEQASTKANNLVRNSGLVVKTKTGLATRTISRGGDAGLGSRAIDVGYPGPFPFI